MMYNFKRICFAAIIASGVATSAIACNNNTVVGDVRDNKIMDARGNCVYTKWTDGDNKCMPSKPIPAKPAFSGFTQNERTIYFDFDSAELTQNAVYKLNRLLAKVKESGMVLSANIVGHTDKLGDAGYNQSLSARRANAVKSYLDSHGFNNTKVMVSAQGESAPVTKGCEKAGGKGQVINCLQPDRRVEIRFMQVK